MRSLIFTYYVHKAAPTADQERMLDLWYRHLRGPGRYEGDIALCTNHASVPYDDVRIIPVDLDATDLRQFWCERVINHGRIPAADYDVVFHFDMDILAVGPIPSLFPPPGDDHLWTASSIVPVHHWFNAGNFYWKPWSFTRRMIGKALGSKGYSAAIFGCRSEHWSTYMDRWAELIRAYKGPLLPLGDQSFLNLAAARRRFPIRSFPLDVVQQNRWHVGPNARVFHFAGVPDRVRVMERHAIV